LLIHSSTARGIDLHRLGTFDVRILNHIIHMSVYTSL